MLRGSTTDDFYQDPLGFLDRKLSSASNVVQTGRNEYCLGNPVDARAVLRNADGSYVEHSDFFHTAQGYFEPKSAQLQMRRQARALLSGFLEARTADDLRGFVRAHLQQTSEWPDAGNWLAYRYLLPVLLAPDSPQSLRRLLDQIVERSVLANARARQQRWRRMLLQFTTTWQLSRAIEARQRIARAPEDFLDIAAGSIEPGQRLDELVEIFLSFLFAVAGSVGFVLAWSVYLWGTHPRSDVPSEWIVQEALRLWPVAWQLGRRPAQSHEISGIKLGTSDQVVVCPYLVQRNAAYWSSPAEFRPERWADREAWRNPAFIPFGYGPHRCVAAELSTRWVSDVLGIIRSCGEVSVIAPDDRPIVAAAMAPPRFTLTVHAAAAGADVAARAPTAHGES